MGPRDAGDITDDSEDVDFCILLCAVSLKRNERKNQESVGEAEGFGSAANEFEVLFRHRKGDNWAILP